MSESSSKSGGVSFLGLLTILFIGLKLTGYISWSWWWVLSPLWIPLAIVLVIFFTWLIPIFLIQVYQDLERKRRIKKMKEIRKNN